MNVIIEVVFIIFSFYSYKANGKVLKPKTFAFVLTQIVNNNLLLLLF